MSWEEKCLKYLKELSRQLLPVEGIVGSSAASTSLFTSPVPPMTGKRSLNVASKGCGGSGLRLANDGPFRYAKSEY